MSALVQKMMHHHEEEPKHTDRFHIASRIEKAIEKRNAATECSGNRSADILPLEREYTEMKANLDALKKIAKEYYTHIQKSSNLRVDVSISTRIPKLLFYSNYESPFSLYVFALYYVDVICRWQNRLPSWVQEPRFKI